MDRGGYRGPRSYLSDETGLHSATLSPRTVPVRVHLHLLPASHLNMVIFRAPWSVIWAGYLNPEAEMFQNDHLWLALMWCWQSTTTPYYNKKALKYHSLRICMSYHKELNNMRLQSTTVSRKLVRLALIVIKFCLDIMSDPVDAT